MTALPSPRGHRPLHTWLAGLALLMVASCGLAWALQRIADRQLQNDAEHVATAWARYVGRAVPGMDAVFRGELPGRRTQEELSQLRNAAGVFRFKVFGADGDLLLESDNLAQRPLQNHGFSEPAARAATMAGHAHTELKTGDGVKRPQVYSETYVPFHDARGRMLGVVEVYVDQAERAATVAASFRTVGAAVGVALLLVAVFAVALWRHRTRQERAAEAQMHYLAHHDVLTGTLNRSSFNAALQHAGWRRAQGGPGFAVLCVDLDHFKDVNDTLGQQAGDELLRQAAQRLQTLVRSADDVARLGGDQFAVLQSGVDQGQDVATLAQRIVECLNQPFDLAGQRCNVSASVGAALHGVDGAEPDELLQHADLALYRAKSNGRCGYSFYDRGLDEQLQTRRELVRELRAAIDNGALHLHFQPVFAGDGRNLLGYEALARWPHPTRGFVPPNEFIPLAEQNGLIDDLGRWVLRTACAEAARWPAPLSVAVNLSPAQFHSEQVLLQEISQALADSGLPAQRLEVEITESLLMSNTDQVLQTLRALHELGVRVAMDDFGTGYSSLAYLWRFPFDKVKIDRAFTSSLLDDSKVDLIVRSIVTLAHSLDIQVNAEGVETDSQLATLSGHGCDELQGYLLGRPTPPDRLPHVLISTPNVLV